MKPIDVKFEVHVANKYINLKNSAESRGLEFSLTLSDVKQIMSKKRCYYTGLEFGREFGGLSFERLNSNVGYVRGNVVACAEKVNQLKANLPLNAILKMAKKLENLS